MEGKNVYLRILELSDIPRTQKWISDPDISENLGYLPVKSLYQQEQWYKSIANDNSRYIFTICLSQTDELIGIVGLGLINYISRNASISIFIYDKSYRGMGYGFEALKLLLKFAFESLNLHKVYARISKSNIQSVNIAKKLGFVQEGILREHYYSGGVYHDKISISLLRSEYKKNPELKEF